MSSQNELDMTLIGGVPNEKLRALQKELGPAELTTAKERSDNGKPGNYSGPVANVQLFELFWYGVQSGDTVLLSAQSVAEGKDGQGGLTSVVRERRVEGACLDLYLSDNGHPSQAVFGSGPEADIHIPNQSAAELQGRVAVEQSGDQLRWVAYGKGIFLNDSKRVDGSATFGPGDCIALGDKLSGSNSRIYRLRVTIPKGAEGLYQPA